MSSSCAVAISLSMSSTLCNAFPSYTSVFSCSSVFSSIVKKKKKKRRKKVGLEFLKFRELYIYWKKPRLRCVLLFLLFSTIIFFLSLFFLSLCCKVQRVQRLTSRQVKPKAVQWSLFGNWDWSKYGFPDKSSPCVKYCTIYVFAFQVHSSSLTTYPHPYPQVSSSINWRIS